MSDTRDLVVLKSYHGIQETARKQEFCLSLGEWWVWACRAVFLKGELAPWVIQQFVPGRGNRNEAACVQGGLLWKTRLLAQGSFYKCEHTEYLLCTERSTGWWWMTLTKLLPYTKHNLWPGFSRVIPNITIAVFCLDWAVPRWRLDWKLSRTEKSLKRFWFHSYKMRSRHLWLKFTCVSEAVDWMRTQEKDCQFTSTPLTHAHQLLTYRST